MPAICHREELAERLPCPSLKGCQQCCEKHCRTWVLCCWGSGGYCALILSIRLNIISVFIKKKKKQAKRCFIITCGSGKIPTVTVRREQGKENVGGDNFLPSKLVGFATSSLLDSSTKHAYVYFFQLFPL